MSHTSRFDAGGYRFVPGVFQYSAGVVADQAHEIIHVRLRAPLPLAAGFDCVAGHLAAHGRPLTAFCACELRSPAPFTEAGFEAFNRLYTGRLQAWGIIGADGVNPVARSNVCPLLDPPSEPSLFAFAFTVEKPGARPTAVVSGSGEVPEGRNSYGAHIVAPGDTSATGMRRKADFVVERMRERMAALGLHDPAALSAVQVYTVEPLRDLLESVLAPAGLSGPGVTWHLARPPIEGLAFEMDVRSTAIEQVL
ncbi:MAG: hypothetical protein R3E83_25625 [Burkholderiaceae bacterium]